MNTINFLDIALLIGSGFALFLFIVLVLFAKRKLSNLFLGLFSGAIFFVLFKGFIHAREYHLEYPSLLFLPVYWTTGFGSFLFFYIKGITNKSFGIDKSIVLAFAPLLAQIAFHSCWYFHSPAEKQSFYDNQYFSNLLLYEEITAIFISSVYTSLAYVKISSFLKSKGKLLTADSLKTAQWSKRLVVVFFVTILMFWTGYTMVDFFGHGYTLPYVAYYPIYFFIVLFIGWVAIGVITIPQIMNGQFQFIAGLEGLNENTALKPLMRSLILPHVFDPKKQPPTVETLASKSGFSEQYLSIYFETHFGMSYHAYVKKIRMKKFKETVEQMVAENLTKSITAVREACGYGTKSTFNRHVKNTFHKSPSDFIASMRS